MGAFDWIDVSHKDYTRVDESNTYCLWSVALLSCDEWPVVTSPLRHSRYVREFQALWRLLLFICLMKYFCCNYLEACNSRPADHSFILPFYTSALEMRKSLSNPVQTCVLAYGSLKYDKKVEKEVGKRALIYPCFLARKTWRHMSACLRWGST